MGPPWRGYAYDLSKSAAVTPSALDDSARISCSASVKATSAARRNSPVAGATFFSCSDAAATPGTGSVSDAVTVKLPTTLLAVNAGAVAMPLASVRTVALAANVPDAPPAGAWKVMEM